jgi:arabinofuranosyltransferase
MTAALTRADQGSSTGRLDLPRLPSKTTASTARVLERYGIVAVAALTAGLGWSYRWTADDAFINFRAIDNLLAGNGMVFNAGQRVEVTTSPLWAYLLAALDVVTPVSLPWLSVLVGLALSVAGVVLACAGCLRLRATTLRDGVMVPFGAVIFLAVPPVWDFITSGLETGLTFAWIGVAWWGLARVATADRDARRPVWLLVTVGLGPLIRPDLAVVTVALVLYLLLSGRQPWLRHVRDVAIAAALPVGYEIFRMGYYGLLVPNTAVAKESTRELWWRGWIYLADFIGPYHLWAPGLLAVAALAALLWQLRGQHRVVALVAVFVVAAAVHVLFVVRVGGDFMHGRLLLPGAMMTLTPVFLLPVTRRLLHVSVAALTLGTVWAALCSNHLRVAYSQHIGPSGIADERGYYVRWGGVTHPVTYEDHTQELIGPYSARVQQLADRGADVIAAQRRGLTPDAPALVLGQSTGGTYLFVGNAGFYGVGVGLDVPVVDFFGLSDPIGAHMAPPQPGRPGHEKQIPLPYLLAMYGSGDPTRMPVQDVQVRPGYPVPTTEDVEAARAALQCGAVAELLAATSDELTPSRFWHNLTGAVERTSMRIDYDPQEQQRRTCG